MRNSSAISDSAQTRTENIEMEQNFANDSKTDIAVRKENLVNRIIQTVVDLIVIICIFIVFGFVYIFQHPKINYFTCDDTDIFYPLKPNTVHMK